MCKTWHLVYACGHDFHFRLSKCRATICTQSRPGRPFRPACTGGATFVFKKAFDCGDCALKASEAQLTTFRERLGVGSREREDAEAELGKEMFQLGRAFPAIERRKPPKPLERCSVPPKGLRGSLLRDEVFREDVKADEVDDDWAAYYEEWDSGWTTTTSDTAVEIPAWESEDVAKNDTPAAPEMPSGIIDFEDVVENAWAEDEYTPNIEPHSTSCCDNGTCGLDRPTQPDIEETLTTPAIYEQADNQTFISSATTHPPSFVLDISNTIVDIHLQKLLLSTTNKSYLDLIPVSLSSPPLPQQAQTPGNQKCKTLPPHVRKQLVSLHRRVSDSDCNESEVSELLEQFKCFQFHAVITLST